MSLRDYRADKAHYRRAVPLPPIDFKNLSMIAEAASSFEYVNERRGSDFHVVLQRHFPASGSGISAGSCCERFDYKRNDGRGTSLAKASPDSLVNHVWGIFNVQSRRTVCTQGRQFAEG